MGHVRRWRGKFLWAPFGAIVAVGALLAGTVFASAAAPNLPKRTPAQLLAAMTHATLPRAMTAVISESADLGFPALPDIAGMPSSALSAASWLAGSHTVQIWYSGPQHVRIAVPVSFGETDLRVNGSQVWLWQSQGQVATHVIIAAPAGPVGSMWNPMSGEPTQGARIWSLRTGAKAVRIRMGRLFEPGMPVQMHFQSTCPMPVPVIPGPASQSRLWNAMFRPGHMTPARMRAMFKVIRARMALHAVRAEQRVTFSTLKEAAPEVGAGAVRSVTPLQAAQRLLAMIGPTTKVSITGTTVVAGRPAYQLAIEPRSNQSLIGQILIAVDGTSFLPLQVQVIPRGSSGPAFSVGFTSLTLGPPAASNFTFTPPPGAHVHVVTLPNPLARPMGMGGLPGLAPGGQFGLPGTPPGVGWRIIKPHGRVVQLGPAGPVTCLPGKWSGASLPQPQVSSQARPQVLGSGWLTVVVVPAGPALAALAGAGGHATHSATVGGTGQLVAMLRLLLNSATRVHGSWGSGRLISTRLINILVTSKGQILVGAVTPAVLYADAAKA